MNPIRRKPQLVLSASVFLIFAFGCTSTKKTAAVTNRGDEKAKMEQEANLRKQKESALRRTETEASLRQDAAQALRIMKENAPKVRLNEYFDAVANSDNAASANSNITRALTMFTSAETPVLIVTSEQGGKKYYDQPTTIKAYFIYLKDLKKNINDIKNLKVNYYGKITEVEIKKNN